MIIVAIVVSLFATGMATFLNYFKYRSTTDRLVKARLVVIGKSIENTIQASLAVGLSFSDLDMLPEQMERELAADDTILGIKVFDTTGKALYATDRLRHLRAVPKAWFDAAERAGNADWFVNEGNESIVGIAIKNNFGLIVGYLALRYSNEAIDRTARRVAKELTVVAFAACLGAALLAALALTFVIRRLENDIHNIESALHSPHRDLSNKVAKGRFGPSLQRFLDTIRTAEAQIAAVRAKVPRGDPR